MPKKTYATGYTATYYTRGGHSRCFNAIHYHTTELDECELRRVLNNLNRTRGGNQPKIAFIERMETMEYVV